MNSLMVVRKVTRSNQGLKLRFIQENSQMFNEMCLVITEYENYPCISKAESILSSNSLY